MQYLHLLHASSSYLIVRDHVGSVWHADSVQWMHLSGSSWLRILTSQSFSSHAAGHQSGCCSSGIEVVVGNAVVAGVGVIVGAEVVVRNVVVSVFSSAKVVAAVVDGASVVVVNAVFARDGAVVGAGVLRNLVVSGLSNAEVVAAVVVNGASVVVLILVGTHHSCPL